MDYLKTIIEHKLTEIQDIKRRTPLEEIKNSECMYEQYSLKNALLTHCPAIIAEIKRRSPSKGEINSAIDPVKLALSYEKAGAAALSVLTDNRFFGGSSEDLINVKQNVWLPVLRKDFIVDTYQIYESKYIGADAILLITSCLERSTLQEFLALAKVLQLETLVEVENITDIEIIDGLAVDIIGVNNRNLHTFEQSIETSFSLSPLLPETAVKVSESSITNGTEIASLYRLGYRGFLIGEMFMRSNNPETAIQSIIKEFSENQ